VASLGLPKSLGPPKRLRTQLLAAFALIIFVALLAAGSTVVWLLQGYRTQIALDALRDTAVAASVAGAALERRGEGPAEIAAGVASQVQVPGAHVLVLDSGGVVVADQAASADAPPLGLQGQTLAVPRADSLPPSATGVLGSPPGGRPLPGGGRPVVWTATVPGPAGEYLFVAAPFPGPGGQGRPGGPGGAGGQSPPPGGSRPPPAAPALAYRIVLAVPAAALPSAWRELAPGLVAAGALALGAAFAVAWLLAGSIARPIARVTRAAQRLARGEPHRSVPEEGVEEVAQLARGFNEMAREVERSQETLRSFVGDASHELRTPLTAIQGFSQAIEDGVLEAPPETRAAAGLLHREAERMGRLVEALLRLSQVEARERPLARRPVDVAELLDAAAERVAPAVRERDLHLALELPERLLVAGDRSLLEHLFGNLVDNAVKYTPAGGAVTVQGALLDGVGRPGGPGGPGDGPLVSVRVHNTGSVIPAEALPHVFERFYRVDKSRARDAREVEGSGLGLAIAREVAERHGGTIRAESDPATGTVFEVILPGVPGAPGVPSAPTDPGASGVPSASGPARLY
jgi:signal transduction histidine kinase